MPQNKINIGILLGDPSGIGPELVSKLLSEEITNKANLIIIGEKKILESINSMSEDILKYKGLVKIKKLLNTIQI